MVVRVGWTNGLMIEMDNVLWIGQKVMVMDTLLQGKAVTVDRLRMQRGSRLAAMESQLLTVGGGNR